MSWLPSATSEQMQRTHIKFLAHLKSYNNDNKNGRYFGLSTSQSKDYWWMGVQPYMGANKM
jgi:hypothetical protein